TSIITVDAPFQVNIVVMAPDGRMISRKDLTNRIDISTLANGTYLIMVYGTDDQLLKTERIIKVN
ncbi:MAG: T9SS type A sorting domain-containing protein, partial [Taibaiella sp.]|nr:T9SS type A sorting domain-containing protein [Taibaiella sp.]